MMTPVTQLIRVQRSAAAACKGSYRGTFSAANQTSYRGPADGAARDREFVAMLAPKASFVTAVMPRLDRRRHSCIRRHSSRECGQRNAQEYRQQDRNDDLPHSFLH